MNLEYRAAKLLIREICQEIYGAIAEPVIDGSMCPFKLNVTKDLGIEQNHRICELIERLTVLQNEWEQALRWCNAEKDKADAEHAVKVDLKCRNDSGSEK